QNVTINKSAVATTNGTSEMLFTSVIKMDSTCVIPTRSTNHDTLGSSGSPLPQILMNRRPSSCSPNQAVIPRL
ncbi:unnamed protein product, partial [Timema podura]|nr:unnamed protein product [Timema podura]